jgi:hypothetical protein
MLAHLIKKIHERVRTPMATLMLLLLVNSGMPPKGSDLIAAQKMVRESPEAARSL